MRARGAQRRGGIVTIAADDLLGTGAVVGEEEDHGVVELAHGFHLLEDLAGLRIHAADHGGVDRHFGALQFLLFRRERGPGDGAGDFSRADFGDQLRIRSIPVGPHVRFKGSERTVDETHAHHALPLAFARGVPAFAETVVIFVDVFLRRLQREMRGVEGGIEEERVGRMFARVFLEEADAIIGDRGGAVVAGLRLGES